jgi:hypothetical protein
MDRDLEEMRAPGPEDRELVERGKIIRMLAREIPATGLDSGATFERFMRALDARRERQRRRRRLLAYLLGAAAVITGLMVTFRLLHR